MIASDLTDAPYTLAGFFLLGGVVGFIAAVRLFRLVLDHVDRLIPQLKTYIDPDGPPVVDRDQEAP